MSDEIKQPIQLFTCEICIEPALSTHKFRHENNINAHNICSMCIASHIQAKIHENIATINCPELNCGETLNPLECRPMISSSLFVKWCDCLCKLSISMWESCYCPNPTCSELILNECDETTKKCTCPRCKSLFCYTCRAPWHAGFRCSESSQVRDANDVRFGLLLEHMKWSRCPSCGQPTDRIDGCRVVICRCGTSFCHECGFKPHFGRCGKENSTVQMCADFIMWTVFSFIIFYFLYLGFS